MTIPPETIAPAPKAIFEKTAENGAPKKQSGSHRRRRRRRQKRYVDVTKASADTDATKRKAVLLTALLKRHV